jgi:hypothetical protein
MFATSREMLRCPPVASKPGQPCRGWVDKRRRSRDSHGPGLFASPVAARSASVSGSTGVPSRSLHEPCLAGLAAPDCGRVEQRRRLLHEPGNADRAQPALPKPKHSRGGESLLRLDQQLPMPFPEFVDYAAMTLHAAGKPFLPEAVDVEVSVS